MSNEQKIAEAVLALHAAFAVLVDSLPYTSLVGGQETQRAIARYAGSAHELVTSALHSMRGEEGA